MIEDKIQWSQVEKKTLCELVVNYVEQAPALANAAAQELRLRSRAAAGWRAQEIHTLIYGY